MLGIAAWTTAALLLLSNFWGVLDDARVKQCRAIDVLWARLLARCDEALLGCVSNDLIEQQKRFGHAYVVGGYL